MPLRDRVRRALNRPVVRRTNRKGVKLEYFHRNEVPRSKFRGPFDPEHQKSLEQWSFTAAMAPRPRSPDLSLSPCTSIPQSNPSLTRPIPSDPPQQQPQQQNHVNHNVDDNEGIAPDQTDVMDSKLFYPGLLSPCIQSSPPSRCWHVADHGLLVFNSCSHRHSNRGCTRPWSSGARWGFSIFHHG